MHKVFVRLCLKDTVTILILLCVTNSRSRVAWPDSCTWHPPCLQLSGWHRLHTSFSTAPLRHCLWGGPSAAQPWPLALPHVALRLYKVTVTLGWPQGLGQGTLGRYGAQHTLEKKAPPPLTTKGLEVTSSFFLFSFFQIRLITTCHTFKLNLNLVR